MPHRAIHKESIHNKKKRHERNNTNVSELRDVRSRLDKLNPLLSEPMQGLDQQERNNQRKETTREVLAEDRDGEENLHELSPGLLVQPLDLGFAEGAEEDELDEVPEGEHEDEAHVEEEHQADLGGGEVDGGGVELAAGGEGVVDY